MVDFEKLILDNFPELGTKPLLTDLESVSTVAHVKKGEVLMDVGQFIKFMPLVTSGLIKVIREDEEGNEILLYYLEGGNTCAMSVSCCLQEVESNIRATVDKDAEIIKIPIRYVDEWMMQHRAWKNFVMGTYSSRFDQLLHSIDTIAFKKVDERLLAYLKTRVILGEEDFVTSTHQEMAHELNTSREVISRMLKKLELENLVRIDKGKIRVITD